MYSEDKSATFFGDLHKLDVFKYCPYINHSEYYFFKEYSNFQNNLFNLIAFNTNSRDIIIKVHNPGEKLLSCGFRVFVHATHEY